MEDYIYKLQKYSGRDSRHTCPACERPHCFSLYVDAEGNPIAEDVGRCEHVNTCGYHKTPKQHFAENPQERQVRRPKISLQAPKNIRPDTIPFELIRRSEGVNNGLMRYLSRFWPTKELQKVTEMYHLGSTRQGEIIYPQIDSGSVCRSGKIILYDENGHRIKNAAFDRIDWLHSRYMKQQGKQTEDYNLEQCLFGEHLLHKRRDVIVNLVESEKAAVIGALACPNNIWVACGGKSMFSPGRCAALAGRDVIVFADADAAEEWETKLPLFTHCHSITMSQWHKNEPAGSKRDIADWILASKKTMQEKPTTVGDVCQWLKELGDTTTQVIRIPKPPRNNM